LLLPASPINFRSRPCCLLLLSRRTEIPARTFRNVSPVASAFASRVSYQCLRRQQQIWIPQGVEHMGSKAPKRASRAPLTRTVKMPETFITRGNVSSKDKDVNPSGRWRRRR
jgi:hypothetical protein